MEGGGSIVVKLAKKAAALARTEWAARVAAMWPRRKYRGVHQRNDGKNTYKAAIWNVLTGRMLWLGSYKTPEEAAYAWDAAARLTRGHSAKPNFPEPDWARAPEKVSTELALALPTPAAAPSPPRRDPAATVAAQISFDNWLLSASAAAAEPQHQQAAPAAVVIPHQQQPTAARPPFTQFFHLSGPDTAVAATNGRAAVVNPSNPGDYVLTPQKVPMPPTNPASTALSSTEPVVHASQSQFLPAAAPTQHRELPVSQASVSNLAVVGDNFTYDGASTSAAPPPAPRLLTPKDLLFQIGLPAGRGGAGGV